jgi:hypothetical protein
MERNRSFSIFLKVGMGLETELVSCYASGKE